MSGASKVFRTPTKMDDESLAALGAKNVEDMQRIDWRTSKVNQ